MLRYEVLFLTVPEITQDETESLKSYFTKAVRDQKGSLLSFDKWGKFRLAYSVKKSEYGVYFLFRFEVEKETRDALLKSVRDGFVLKFNNIVTKNMIERLDSEASLEYKRPESLEDNPQDVDTFLKRNEMNGLLKKGPARKNEEQKEAATEESVESADSEQVVAVESAEVESQNESA